MSPASEKRLQEKRIAADILIAALGQNSQSSVNISNSEEIAKNQSKALASAYKTILEAVSTPSA